MHTYPHSEARALIVNWSAGKAEYLQLLGEVDHFQIDNFYEAVNISVLGDS